MKINADFDQRCVVHSASTDWLDSPIEGVYRRPLDRVGHEVARATSIVRYDAGSRFSPHVHQGGEEFFVIDGVFQDEHGDYPQGSYIRNPPQSRHTPSSEAGCVIFVKLWQFDPADRSSVRLNTNFMKTVPHRHLNATSVIPLYADHREEVSIFTWEKNSHIQMELSAGAEILVLSGDFVEGQDTLVKHSWLRLPIGSTLSAHTANNGARVWIKQHHMSHVETQIRQLAERGTNDL